MCVSQVEEDFSSSVHYQVTKNLGCFRYTISVYISFIPWLCRKYLRWLGLFLCSSLGGANIAGLIITLQIGGSHSVIYRPL